MVASSQVVLVGPPGAGKSTIGHRLSDRLGLALTDTDKELELLMGRPCGEVFSVFGEPGFRRVEEKIVAACLSSAAGVLSLGGGAVLSPQTRELLLQRTVVFLDVDIDEGIRRTANTQQRPVLASKDPAKHYRQLVAIRRPLYEEVASIIVKTGNQRPEAVVSTMLEKLAPFKVLTAIGETVR